MTHTILMPDCGQTMNEYKILKLLKQPGEKISRGDHLLEVETDKVSMEVESYLSGYLRQVLVSEGQVVATTTPIAIVTDTLEEPLERLDLNTPPAMPAGQPVITPPPAAQPAIAPLRAPAPPLPGLAAAPAAKALAKELGIDLSLIPGTGPGGLITRKDVERIANSIDKTQERLKNL
jgi:pyruvate dehydrogenase E2 component (dihydrolipoamide acetyltransferase)